MFATTVEHVGEFVEREYRAHETEQAAFRECRQLRDRGMIARVYDITMRPFKYGAPLIRTYFPKGYTP